MPDNTYLEDLRSWLRRRKKESMDEPMMGEHISQTELESRIDGNWLHQFGIKGGEVASSILTILAECSDRPPYPPRDLRSELVASMAKHSDDPSQSLGPPIRPRKGLQPLFDAAHWIATQGGTIAINTEDIEVWRSAYGELLQRAVSGQMTVFGRKVVFPDSSSGVNESIPACEFVGIGVSYPYHENLAHEDSGGRPCPHIDSAGKIHDRSSLFYGDRFFDGNRKLRWICLQVEAAKLAALWPFHVEPLKPVYQRSGGRKKKDAPRKGAVKQAFRDAIEGGQATLVYLKGLPQKTLVDQYGKGAGRTTVVESLHDIEKEFTERDATNSCRKFAPDN
jgi:hypothetical protein